MGCEIDAHGAIACTRLAGVHAQPQERESGAVTYNREPLIAEICERLAEGETLASICSDPHMPEARTVRGWALADERISSAIASARVLGFDAIAEECLQIANTPQQGETITSKEWGEERKTGDMLEHRKLQIWTRLQLLAKWDPKRYGDKQQVEHSGHISLESLVTEAGEAK